MTIASAIDDVIIAQGGTPDPSDTIEESIRNLGQYIGGGGNSYDVVIWEDTTTSVPAYELVSGDWEAVKEKIMGGEIINGILKAHEKDPVIIKFTSLTMATYNESPESITLSFVIPSWTGNTVTWFPQPLTWTSNGMITD